MDWSTTYILPLAEEIKLASVCSGWPDGHFLEDSIEYRIIVWRLLVWLVQAAALQSWHVPQITAESEMRSTWRNLVCCALFHAWSSTLMHCGAPNTFVELRVHATEIECACYNFLCAGFSDVWAHMCMDNKMDPNRWHTYRKNIYTSYMIYYILYKYIYICVLYMYVYLFMFFICV